MKKKGQVTVFVIIGIVLIFIFGFAIFAVQWINDSAEQKEAENIVEKALADIPINSYVTSCLEAVTSQGIQEILLQGGNLYSYNYYDTNSISNVYPLVEGTTYIPFNHSGKTVNVSYSITPNVYCEVTKKYILPPAYPYPNKYLRDLLKDSVYYNDVENNFVCARYGKESGFFGLNNLTKLCDWQGPNYNPDAYSLYGQQSSGGVFIATCKKDDFYDYFASRTGQKNMQKQLAEYIEQHLPFCTNFSEFNQRMGGNVVIINDPKVRLIYGSSSVITEAEYRFSAGVKGSSRNVFHGFSANIEIPLQEIYGCAHELVKREVQDIFFNKTSSFYEISECSGFLYKEHRNVCPGCQQAPFDDVIEIIDSNKIIRGSPLTFLLGIKNRRPALEYYRDVSLDMFTSISDLQFIENQTIELVPEGFDPDDLNITYNYSGWREDYIDYFNKSCCLESGIGTVNCTVNISHCMISDSSSAPKNWSGSNEFIISRKNASYKTSAMDAGLHLVNITIWDRQGFFNRDYQTLRILVFDLPVAVINTSNNFSDIPDNYASIEDPYILSANNSKKSTLLTFQNLTDFLWEDRAEPFLINTTNSEIVIPLGNFSINTSMQDSIIPKIFAKNITRNISLIVGQPGPSNIGMLYSHPVFFEVEVLQCLPHRDTSASWPYNNERFGKYTSIENPFLANHTCCDNSSDNFGAIKSTSNICFGYQEFGSYLAFTKSFSVPFNPFYNPGQNPDLPGNYHLANDIFFRQFTRNCSGTSGNTCTGNYFDYREIYLECGGYTPGKSQETCSGPNTTASVENSSEISCILYEPGESFEKIFGLQKVSGGVADGTCDGKKLCASNLGSKGGEFLWDPESLAERYPFKCSSQCKDGGCKYPLDDGCICWSGVDENNVNYCNSDILCHNRLPGDTTGSTGSKPEKGCDSQCYYLDCTPYAFDRANLQCFTKETTVNDLQCDDGYFRDFEDFNNPENVGKCIGEIGNSNVEDLGPEKDGQCEYVLGASIECDEIFPNSPAKCSNGVLEVYCDSTCAVSKPNKCSVMCGADTQCNGLPPGACISGNQGRWCSNSCQYMQNPSC